MAKDGVIRIGKIPLIGADRELINLYPVIMEDVGKQSLEWFLEGFRSGGKKTNASRSGWPVRKSKKNDQGRAILVLNGHLYDDIDVRESTSRTVTIGTDVIPYAARHNEGLAGMPQREFIGESDDLNDLNEELIMDLIDEIL